jgi:uncharacterized DUF497 family protein
MQLFILTFILFCLDNGERFIEIPSRIQDEPRFVVIGKIISKHWSGVITYRDQNIRIISVRRSRTQEVALYER